MVLCLLFGDGHEGHTEGHEQKRGGAAGATSGEPWVGFMASAAWKGDWENALEANIGSGRTSASVAAGGFFVLEIKKALEGIPKPP